MRLQRPKSRKLIIKKILCCGNSPDKLNILQKAYLGSPVHLTGQEQKGWWFLTEHSAPAPHLLPSVPAAQGSTHLPASQDDVSGQSADFWHSGFALQPWPLLDFASPTCPSGQEQRKEPGRLEHLAVAWQGLDLPPAHSSTSTQRPFWGT